MNCQLDQVVNIIGEFVAERRGVAKSAVTSETRLFHEGYVDSFSLVELTANLESALGSALPDGALIPEDFETPRAVFERLQQL